MPIIRSRADEPEPPTEPAPLDAEALRADLASDSVERRCDAVRRAQRGGGDGLLSERLAAERHPRVRDLLLSALARSGDPARAAALLDLLRSEDAGMRNAVLEAFRGTRCAPKAALELLLIDPERDVRILALNLLAASGDPDAAALAARVLDRDEDVNVCAAAVDVVAETGSPRTSASLRAAICRFPDQPFLAFAVRAALRRIG